MTSEIGPPPPPGQAPPPPGQAPPAPPYWGGPPAWSSPPAPGKENVLGIVGLVCSIAGVLLLLVTIGFFWFLSLPLSVAGLVCGLLGKQKVDRGELPGGRGISQAGFVVGIVGVALHLLAAILFVALLGLLFEAADDIDFEERPKRRDLDGIRALFSLGP